ncbi:multiple monosaccharide ABC transporter permease [Ruminiclostridium cellobioparum]|uniref:Xylose transport system permease protein XylH n=1 Tax=Ruminiclostridium cellobioparum subsp. termitidis CT1112 TaxID=1195236 RepID=S0FGW0_RUMCE|nr:multiple monosaccharide ABC transporter permease [Ruminiclostridium cellobioparum]EMS69016.1 ABC-type xylose transport system, permease component [Ruminiclostridium cellobioparum subsp. termitidis CT1112]
MTNFKSFIKNNIRQYAMALALVVIMVLFQIMTGGILFKPLNITNLILQNSYVLILGIGMLLVILTGNVDLSVGSVAAFIGAISAIFMVQMHMPVVIAVVLCLVIGALVGAWQGFWIAYIRIPAFIVTLAGMLVFRGLTMVLLKGQTISPYEESFQAMANGFFLSDVFKVGGLNMIAVITGIILSLVFIFLEYKNIQSMKKYNFETLPLPITIGKTAVIVAAINLLTVSLAAYKGIPIVLILIVALIAIYTFITQKTIAGRHIYALGGNEKAAKLSGIKTKRVMFWVYVNMGLLAALAGLVVAGRLNAATPKAGTNFELDAIAACFIGGASASGGIGTIIGAIIGALVMGVLNNGMSIMGVGIDWQQAIKGLVLLAAVAFDVYTKSKSNAD